MVGLEISVRQGIGPWTTAVSRDGGSIASSDRFTPACVLGSSRYQR